MATKSLTFAEIIDIANEAYPDGLIGQAYNQIRHRNKKIPNVGDGLAEFIVRELKDTFEPKASSLNQLTEAARVMKNARAELEAVEAAFQKKLQ